MRKKELRKYIETLEEELKMARHELSKYKWAISYIDKYAPAFEKKPDGKIGIKYRSVEITDTSSYGVLIQAQENEIAYRWAKNLSYSNIRFS